jgi:hypothetical protein
MRAVVGDDQDIFESGATDLRVVQARGNCDDVAGSQGALVFGVYGRRFGDFEAEAVPSVVQKSRPVLSGPRCTVASLFKMLLHDSVDI